VRQLLAQDDVDLNTLGFAGGATPLLRAVYNHHTEIINLFLVVSTLTYIILTGTRPHDGCSNGLTGDTEIRNTRPTTPQTKESATIADGQLMSSPCSVGECIQIEIALFEYRMLLW
jgi:hypothetical protein